MNCNQDSCRNVGAYRFTWPGKDEALICEEHVGKLRGVAAAMGLHLEVRPIMLVAFPDMAHFEPPGSDL